MTGVARYSRPVVSKIPRKTLYPVKKNLKSGVKQVGRVGLVNKVDADHKLLMSIAKEINCDEVKYLLLSNQGLSGATAKTPYSLLLNGLTRGTTVQSRVADKYKGLQLKIKGYLASLQTSNTQQSNLVRIMILKDTEANGAVPAFVQTGAGSIGYLFNGPSATTVNSYQMYNFNNTDISRFRILYDDLFTITYGVNTAAQLAQVFRPVNIEVKNLGCFSSVRGNVGDVTDMEQSLYIFMWSDNGSCSFTFDSAFYFSDN